MILKSRTGVVGILVAQMGFLLLAVTPYFVPDL